jgi:tRNA U55 pseudouridine synthase TruB
MTALRRLSCGRFDLAASHPLPELQELAEQGGPLPLLPLAGILDDWPALTVGGLVLERLLNGVAPRLAELSGDQPAAGARVRLLAGDSLVAVARYIPGEQGKRAGDFELLKVFPVVDDA